MTEIFTGQVCIIIKNYQSKKTQNNYNQEMKATTTLQFAIQMLRNLYICSNLLKFFLYKNGKATPGTQKLQQETHFSHWRIHSIIQKLLCIKQKTKWNE